MQLSNRLTFSLASLFLIFALAFVATPVTAEPGGPTVSITEYSGVEDPNAAPTGQAMHEQTRDDFRVKVEFSVPVTGTVDTSNVIVSGAASLTSALTPYSSGVTITAATGATDAGKVWYVAINIETGDTNFAHSVLTVNIAEDAVTGNVPGNQLKSQAKSQTFQTLPKSIDWGVTPALDAATFKTADDIDGDNFKAGTADNAGFTVNFTFSPGTIADGLPSLTAARIQVKDNAGDDVPTSGTNYVTPAVGSAVGSVYPVTFSFTGAVAHPVTIGVNPNWAGNGATVQVPAAGAPSKTPVNPVVDISLFGAIDETAKTFEVKFTFEKATVDTATQQARGVPGTLVASEITLQKEDPDDPMEMIDSDAYVEPNGIIKTRDGVFLVTVNYRADALPVYVGTSKAVSDTTISGMDPGADDPSALMVGMTQQTNTPPVFKATAATSITGVVGTAITAADVSATDADNDTLAYSWDVTDEAGLGLALDTATGMITGTPLKVHDMSHTVTVNDGTVDVTHTIQVTITDPSNAAPVFKATAATSITGVVGTAITAADVSATDADNDTLAYSWDVTDEAGLGLALDTATGMITGTPLKVHDMSHTVTVNDGTVDVTHTIQVTITVNNPPVFVVNAKTVYEYTVDTDVRSILAKATDIEDDAAGVNLTYSIADDELPSGLEFDSVSREISGNPDTTGSTDVIYMVTDSGGETAELTITFNVISGPAEPPIVRPVPQPVPPTFGSATVRVPALTVGTAMTPVDLPEATRNTGALTYSLWVGQKDITASGYNGLSYDAQNVQLMGTPVAADPTGTIFTWRATDGATNLSRDLTFNVVVNQKQTPQPGPAIATLTGTPSLTSEFEIEITFDKATTLSAGDILITPNTAGHVTQGSLSPASGSHTMFRVRIQPFAGQKTITVTIRANTRIKPHATNGSLTKSAPIGTLSSITASAGADDRAKFIVTLTFAEALPAGMTVTAADLMVTGGSVTAVGPKLGDAKSWEAQIMPTGGVDVVIGLSPAGMERFSYSGSAITVAKYTDPIQPTIGALIPAKGFAIVSRADVTGITSNQLLADMPDLQRFLAQRGSITLYTTDTAIKANDVVISEIMWGLNLTAPTVAGRDDHQWIELYNATNSPIALSKIQIDFEQSFALPTDVNKVDQFSNVERAGWEVDQGQNGSLNPGANVAATNLVSMYRNINYDKVETELGKATVNIGERNKGIPNGRAKGSWKTSHVSDIYAANRIGSPGKKHILIGANYGPTSVPRSPIIITEVGNLTGESHDWIELTAIANINLEKYELQYVKSDKTIVVLAQFVKKELKAGEILLVLGTHPSNANHPIAAGKEWKLGAADQVKPMASSLYHVDSRMKLPDSIGKATFILRKEKGKTNHEHIIDLAGNLFIADSGAAYRTNLWPLRATAGGHGNVIDGGVEDFNAPRAYQRNDRGSGIGEKDWNVRGFTGVGYDRNASGANAPGTPGFDNSFVRDKSTALTGGKVSISEVMYEKVGNAPQWIELYNSSKTEGVNLNEWKLRIENPPDDEAVDIRFRPTIQFGGVHIPPNETVLIVSAGSGQNSGNFPRHRVIDLWATTAHRNELESGSAGRNYQLLSTEGFELTLIQKGGTVVDTVGNLGMDWELPASEAGTRGSIIREYTNRQASNGTWEKSWTHASASDLTRSPEHLYYGRRSDIGTPGYRGGGPLPVSLSKFRPERLDDGTIVVRWITESELDNAGFNILRSETKDGEFTKLNEQLIAGKGTTSERNTYDFVDTSAKPNVVYYYQIQDVSLDGEVATLKTTHLRGNISVAGKLTTTWGELKALQ